jgi:hypothetical protein
MTLLLLKALPETEASPETWNRIAAQLPPRRTARLRFWLRTAAAASVLAAIASFAALLTTPSSRAFPVVVGTGKALSWGESFRAPSFTRIEVPGVGTLKLNQDTTLRFPDPRTAILESGELFAEITPSGRGFEIRTGDLRAQVHGTRFGVHAPETVYVVEGRVEVASPRGRLELGPNQAAVGYALVEGTPEQYLQWLQRYERPVVRLKLDPGAATRLSPDARPTWNLILETDALAPLSLGDLRDVSQFLSLTINGIPVSLDPSRAAVRAAPRPNGLVRLDSSHPVIIECAVDASLFPRGRSTVRAVFTSGSNAPEQAWKGIVQSEPVTVEVP